MHAKIITLASITEIEKSLIMLVTLWVTYFQIMFFLEIYVVNELISSY